MKTKVKGRFSQVICILFFSAFLFIGAKGERHCIFWEWPLSGTRDAGSNDELKWVLEVEDGAALVQQRFQKIHPQDVIYVIAPANEVKAFELRLALAYLLWPNQIWKIGVSPYDLTTREIVPTQISGAAISVFYKLSPPENAKATPLGNKAAIVFADKKS